METSGDDEYRQDGDDGYYDEDEEEQDSRSFEEKLRYIVRYSLDDLDFYDRARKGHQFEDFIRDCTWKGLDCKTRYGLICVELIRLL